MLKIYASEKSNRLDYVLDFCFSEKGCEYEIISTETEWLAALGVKLNYSHLELEADLTIRPSGILSDTNIDLDLKLEKIGEEFALNGVIDQLSTIFYLISRYEEYQPHQKDLHGRYTAAQSQQLKYDILMVPFADQLNKEIWNSLKIDYAEVQQRFECVPSFDIDVAWAYKHRPFWRRVGAFTRGRLTDRIAVLTGLKKDPYDTYSQIVKVSTDVDRIICFAPVADYGKYDKNIHWKNEDYRSLIRGLNSDGGLGLHPGYASSLKPEIIEDEKKRLEEILGHTITKSRFHFLKFEIPASYQLQIDLGFRREYSMGYSDHAGFRAGTSFPYKFFDLEKNEVQDYLIFPFAYMDSSLRVGMNMNPKTANETVKKLVDEVKNVGGVLMCIWHNHTINDKKEWQGWADVLFNTVKWSIQK